jgi:hypothetical protein
MGLEDEWQEVTHQNELFSDHHLCRDTCYLARTLECGTVRIFRRRET